MPANSQSDSGLTPLREPTFFILLALSRQPKHGYAILKDVERLSEGRVQLSTGTLYGALARLQEQAVVQPAGLPGGQDPDLDIEEQQGGRPRRYYELTALGRQVLAEELSRLSELISVARRQLGPEGT